MEQFTVIHKACGDEATVSYTIATGWWWNSDEGDELPYDVHTITIDCKQCNVSVEIDAKRY